ncbi:hypothetical protein [Bradyrhizobium sp. AUGA SZCCT0160]|uniref:hypothetical protein n=1 Tax=Bradyrhizobium sp. AUGA SZCCT0160 TaxID=2807662 RepID=UPI00390C90F4
MEGIATRLRAKSRSARIVTVRVRFAGFKLATGNPYRDLIFGLMNGGVMIDIDAMARTIQLVQQGFVKIPE